MLKVLDLFSGIGGFSLGLERTGGFQTVAFCEIEPFCRRVLAKHWPGVPIHEDVRKLRGSDVGAVDVICGGYPCQPFSTAGQRRGAEDDRHLWPEMRRLVDELRPAWVIGENVAGHIGMGLDVVLSDLGSLGYSCRPFAIPAVGVGAPHRRERLWIVANALHDGIRDAEENISAPHECGLSGWTQLPAETGGCRETICHSDSERKLQSEGLEPDSRGWACDSGWWSSEPDVGRVAHGVPSRVDRLRGLGNAVVPQIPEIIGRAILTAEAAA